jgi:hypothetical protein
MKDDTKSLLTNRFQKTYNAREVDARLRILNEKRTSFMSTNPLSYVVVDVEIHTEGSSYKVNDIISVQISPKTIVEFFVKEVDTGKIKKLDWDHSKTYIDDPESKRYDDAGLSLDHPDVDDPILPWPVSNIQSQGTGALLILVSRYADGDVPYYNDLGRMIINDPLTQESRVKGMITQALENKIALEFTGFICHYIYYDNNGTTTGVGPIPMESWLGEHPEAPAITKINDVYYNNSDTEKKGSYIANFIDGSTVLEWKFLASYNVYYRVVAKLEEGNLWLISDLKPTPAETEFGTGEISSPGSPSENWSTEWRFDTDILRWNGISWTTIPLGVKYFNQPYYIPERLDLWTNLNVLKFDQDNFTDENGNNDYTMNNPSIEYHILGSVIDTATLPTTGKSGDAYLVSGRLYIWKNTQYVDASLDDDYLNSFTYDNDSNISSPNSIIQNTGWYWFDSWRLFNFSLDETRFVHINGTEIISGTKTFFEHPRVPQMTHWVDDYTDSVAITEAGINTHPSIHYATQSQIVSSTLLLSPRGKGTKQNVGGTTKFSGQHYIGSFDSTSDTPINDSPTGKKQDYDETNYYDGKSYYTPGISNSVFVVGPNTYSNFRKNVIITDLTESNSMTISSTNYFTLSNTGSLVIVGGTQIGKNLNVGGSLMVGGSSAFAGEMTVKDIVTIENGAETTRGSQETTTITGVQDGALRVMGGANIGKRLIVRGTQTAEFTPANSQTGAFTVLGGANVKDRVRIESDKEAVYDPKADTRTGSTNNKDGFSSLSIAGGVDIVKQIQTKGTIIINPRGTYTHIYDEGLRINKSSSGRSVISMGDTAGSVGITTNSNTLNIVLDSLSSPIGTGIGYNDNYLKGSGNSSTTGDTIRAAAIFIPTNGNGNPYINGTQIPNLAPITGGSGSGTGVNTGITTDTSAYSNKARITNVVTAAPAFGGTFYIPKITATNRGMIYELQQTQVTIPNKHAEVGSDGIINLYNSKPETQDTDNDTGAIGTSIAASRGDHRHPHDTHKANLSGCTFTGYVTISKDTDSSSTSTGALIISGGVGIAKKVYIGSTLNVTGATTLSSTLSVTGATTLSSASLSSTLSVTGATTLNSTLGVTGATTLSSTLGVT